MRRLAALLGLVVFVYPSAGRACMNGTLIEKDEMVRRLNVAEVELEAGGYAKARGHLLLRGDEVVWDQRLDRRRRLLLAVVNLRMGKTRAAERVFRRHLQKKPDDPRLRAWLAESLAPRTGFDAVEAWRILDDLERRDLMPEPEAWAALARLRERDRDREGRDRAVARCRATARRPETCPVFASLASR